MRSLALKHVGIRTLAAGCVVALLAVLAVVVPSTATAQNLTAEQVNDELGIGVNLGNALEGPREGAWGLTLQADFFTTIAEAGFGHVRVPIRFSAYADTMPPYEIPDGIDPTVPNADNLWDRIDWVIANAEANDLYVILDLHHYDELFDDVAGERARFLAIWAQIAQRYQNASSKVLFEVLNEPHGQFNDNPALLNGLLADALDVVRATNPTRPVLVGPVFWNSIGSLGSLVLPDDPNLIVSVHFYEPFAFTHQGAEWINPSPPTPATFDSDLIGFGAGWGNWSWDSSAVGSSSTLRVTYDRQWAGLGFGRPGLVDPDTLTVSVSGIGELAVVCSAPGAGGTSTEVDRIVSTATSQAFNIDMTSCPNQTDLVAFMMASPTYGQLSFTNIELCEENGLCTRLIESQAQAIEGAFAQAADWAQRNGRPINVGEFGAYSANGQAALSERVEWTEAVRAAGRSHGFSMSYWEFGAGFGVYDPNTSTWVAPLLDALDVEAAPAPTPTATPNVVDPPFVKHGSSTWETNADAVSVDVNASGDGVVAAVKQDGRLYVRRFDASGSFGAWRQQGLDGWASTDVVIDANGRVELVGVKDDGRLYTRSWTAAGVFGSWQRHGLATWEPDAKPAIATNGSQVTFAAVKTGGRLYTRERSLSSGWGAYTSHGAATWAQVDVATAADGDVWFAGTKTDGRLYVRNRIGSVWSGFSRQGASTWSPTVPPSIAARSNGVVYAATKADGRVFTRQQSSGAWSGFVAHGAGSWGGASVDMTETGRIGLIAVKNAGALYTRTLTTSWGSWTRHGRNTWSPGSLPAATVNDTSTHLAAVKTSGALYTRPIN